MEIWYLNQYRYSNNKTPETWKAGEKDKSRKDFSITCKNEHGIGVQITFLLFR